MKLKELASTIQSPRGLDMVRHIRESVLSSINLNKASGTQKSGVNLGDFAEPLLAYAIADLREWTKDSAPSSDLVYKGIGYSFKSWIDNTASLGHDKDSKIVIFLAWREGFKGVYITEPSKIYATKSGKISSKRTLEEARFSRELTAKIFEGCDF